MLGTESIFQKILRRKEIPRGNPRGTKKMTQTLTRAEELRNDLDNLHYNKKYLIEALATLELVGKTNTWEYQKAEINLNIINKNIRRIEAEVEKIEADEFNYDY